MDKRKPTYDLGAFKASMGDPDRLAMTVTAARTAQSLGFDRKMVSAAVRSLERRHFVKSTTSFRDHTRWQDVYHLPWTLEGERLTIYRKFTADAVTEFTILSFKEK